MGFPLFASLRDQMPDAPVFELGRNCWSVADAAYASVLIDAENYYRALHEAIRKARFSIFIVGWDIDSRIRLLRGEDEHNSSWPSVISDLLAEKARLNPRLNVYLLRWDSSLAFFSKREFTLKQVWDQKTPANVQTLLDSSIPMGGCQHQKIVVVDDEIAFSGGMDVSIQRWDSRSHHLFDPRREDEAGSYEPHHDVQAVVAGPIVEHFAELVRWRWNRVADEPAAPMRQLQYDKLTRPPSSWPDSARPDFRNISCAIARTVPFMDDVQPVQEVRAMFLDLIRRAENLIYLEHQFASRQEIAEAINARLKESESLRVLLVSSYRPQGAFECEAYWASRIDFRRILEEGIEPGRVLLLYSYIRDEHGHIGHKRIHSKVTAVDDKYLVIGSANISNRSLCLDTECDLVFAAANDEQRQQIATIRNDMIGEHCGRTAEEVAELIEEQPTLDHLLEPAGENRYCLEEVQDELFTDQVLQAVMQSVSDPEEPMIPSLQLKNGRRLFFSNPSRRVISTLVLATVVASVAGLVYLLYSLGSHINPARLQLFLETSRDNWWALPAVCLVYLIGGITFFPVTVLSLAVAAIFGPILGPLYGICGALLSAALLFYIGHMLGMRGLRGLGGPKVRLLDEKFKRGGIVGVAALRMLPIAPYSLVNLVAGISSVSLTQFLVGTFLGMFPTMMAKGLVGDSLVQIFINPTPLSVTYLVLGIMAWISVALMCQKLANWYQRRRSL